MSFERTTKTAAQPINWVRGVAQPKWALKYSPGGVVRHAGSRNGVRRTTTVRSDLINGSAKTITGASLYIDVMSGENVPMSNED
jgi:hypothetical protein